MVTKDDVEEIRVKVYEEFKVKVEATNHDSTGLTLVMIDVASKVCSKMLEEFAKKLENKN